MPENAGTQFNKGPSHTGPTDFSGANAGKQTNQIQPQFLNPTFFLQKKKV